MSPLWRILSVLAVVAVAVLAGLGAGLDVDPGLIGGMNDDAMYATYAEALRHGLGYVDTAPVTPVAAHRYPIGFPALLALVSAGAGSFAEAAWRMQVVGPLSLALLVLLSAFYLRRSLKLPFGLALAGAAMVGLGAKVQLIASMVLSDTPAAVLSMLAFLAGRRALAKDERRSAVWLALAVLMGGCMLMRYALGVLPVALVLALVFERRWRAAGAVLAGLLLPVVPWVAFRLATGGEQYQGTLAFLQSHDAAFLLKAAGEVVRWLVGSALPGFVLPTAFAEPHLLAFAAGAAVVAVMLLGALGGLRRPILGWGAFDGLYFLLTVLLVAVWMVSYSQSAVQDVLRLLLPIAPLAVGAFLVGLRLIADRLGLARPMPRVGWAALAAVVAWVGYAETAPRLAPAHRADQEATAQRERQLFDYVRREVPPDAVLLSLRSSYVHVQTKRHCYAMQPWDSNRQVLYRLGALQVSYLVGLPFWIQPPPSLNRKALPRLVDASVLIVNDLNKRYPGLLTPAFVAPGGKAAVFKVDQARLRAIWANHP